MPDFPPGKRSRSDIREAAAAGQGTATIARRIRRGDTTPAPDAHRSHRTGSVIVEHPHLSFAPHLARSELGASSARELSPPTDPGTRVHRAPQTPYRSVSNARCTIELPHTPGLDPSHPASAARPTARSTSAIPPHAPEARSHSTTPTGGTTARQPDCSVPWTPPPRSPSGTRRFLRVDGGPSARCSRSFPEYCDVGRGRHPSRPSRSSEHGPLSLCRARVAQYEPATTPRRDAR